MKCLKSCNLKKSEEPVRPSMIFQATERQKAFNRGDHDIIKDSCVEPYDVPLPKRKSFSKRVSTSVDRGKLSVDEVRQINVKKNN